MSLADAPRRRRSSAPALHYQPHGGSVVSTSTGRQGSTGNSPCAGPEFPEAVVAADPGSLLPPSLLNCPPALGNSPIVGELAAGVPHPAGNSYVTGPAGGGSSFYASMGLYASPDPLSAAAQGSARTPLRMLHFGAPLNTITSMDQSWPPSIASSIDMHGSLGGGSQGDGLGSGSQGGGSVCSRLSSRRGSKDSVLERSASELMASVGEAEEGGGDEAGAEEAAPQPADTSPAPGAARRAPPAPSPPASSPPASSPPPTRNDATRDALLGGVMRAQGNPGRAAAQRWGVNVA